MLEAFIGTDDPAQAAALRELELAAFGRWYVVAVLNRDYTQVHRYQAATVEQLPYIVGVIAGTAEDGGPLTHMEALAAKVLLER